MPVYVFSSTCGFVAEQARAVAERASPSPCPCCAGQLRRDFSREVGTITIAPVPLNFFTQWGDLYSESPREMAHRRDLDRYDPSMPHKPQIPRTRLPVPRGIEDVDTLVKALAPVDGRNETEKLLARVAPVQGEHAYS